MNILMTILYILLFIVFLSILIVVHELGHFAMCKAFKVYVFEFSIGMGPAIFKKKRKNGETQFSLRAIPFGGYVSMYDDEATIPEGLTIDPSRSMNATKKWKRAIIMVAGVTMNIVLAFSIYFVSSLIPKNQFYYNYVTGFSSRPTEKVIIDAKKYGSSIVGLDENAIVHFKDDTVKDGVVAAVDLRNFGFGKPEIINYLNFYYPTQTETKNDKGETVIVTTISANEIVDISKVSYVDFKFTCFNSESSKASGKEIYDIFESVKVNAQFDDKKSHYYYSGLETKYAIEVQKPKNFGEVINKTCAKFGDGATTIIKSLGMLITNPAQTISDSGGIIAIGFESSNILRNAGWSYYLDLWAMISVNLAIINILPFPGLDGWHLLVLAVEGITRKKIPNKVKNVIAFVGLAILFALMIMLLFKDTFKYIFHIGVRMML